MTAHRALFADGSINGQTVLVTGGAGAVGHYAIQLAKWGGAQVVTTISNDEKADHARAAGADHVLNYRSDDVAAAILDLTNGEGVDRVAEVDFGDNLATNVQAVKVNGVIAPYASMRSPEPALPYYPLMMRGIHIEMVFVYQLDAIARRAAVTDLTTCLRDGVLHHAIGARFPLADTAAAHLAQEQENTIGNIVIDI
jgi:NADPH2:quinone reductase